MKKILMTSTMLIVAASLAACSATPVRRSVKETWNDSLTASKIRYKMMRDDEVKKSRMHVQVFRGQVTLTGRAVSDAERARAEQLAKSVKRVTAVENYVHVVGGGAATAAVAKAPDRSPGQAPKAGSTAAPIAGVATIEEKVIVTDNIKVEEDFAPAAPARVPTIRESTGSRAPRPAVASRKAAAPRAESKAAPKSVSPAAKETQLATVRPPAPKDASLIEKAISPKTTEAPDRSPGQVPASKVVGQAKTGLPWDGEVYEDDASSVRAKSSTVVTKSTATAAAPKAPTAEGTSPQASTPPPTDDLAREAAEELEKLRSKR